MQARRLCLGNLPGYEALRQRRGQLIPREGAASDATVTTNTLAALTTQRWSHVRWHRRTHPQAQTSTIQEALSLEADALVAITGPSGSGKTSLIDRICGLLSEEESHWE